MKDQATHIRLIRDENGKPVEAEYTAHWSTLTCDWEDFDQWAEANRIPVTGDWPDREVFAMDEVAEQPKMKVYNGWEDISWEQYYQLNNMSKGVDWDREVKLFIRLKAKQESEEERLNRFIGNDTKLNQCSKANEQPCSKCRGKGYVLVKTTLPDIPARKFCECRQKQQEEQPKQEVKAERITVALVRDLLNQVTKEEISFSRMVEILRETQSSFAKQQYQQEIIEKLRALSESSDSHYALYNDGYHTGVQDAINLLKST